MQVLQRQFRHPGARPDGGGVVDQRRERPKLTVYRCEQPFHLRGIAHVRGHCDGPSAAGLELRAQPLRGVGLGAVVDAYRVAAPGQQARGRRADSAAGSGDNRYFAHRYASRYC